MPGLTHVGPDGGSRMVDVADKQVTQRMACASGRVRMAAATQQLIREQGVAKGPVLEVARVAGVQAAKRTAELIPLCHTLPLDGVSVEFSFPDAETVEIQCVARATARTGVEMEALTAVAVAGLVIYDMCKAVDRGMEIGAVRLEEKHGGRSGSYVAPARGT